MAIKHPDSGKFISPTTPMGRDQSLERRAQPGFVAGEAAAQGQAFDLESQARARDARADTPVGEQLKAAHGFGLDSSGAPRRFMPGHSGAAPRAPVDPHRKTPNL